MPNFCMQCGRPLEGKTVCECGWRADTVEGTVSQAASAQQPQPASDQAAGGQSEAAGGSAAQAAAKSFETPEWLNTGAKTAAEWFKAVGQQVLRVLRMEADRPTLPWQVVLTSMGTRALVLSLILHIWVRAKTSGLRTAASMFGGPNLNPNVFGWSLLALVVAAAAALGIVFLTAGKDRFEAAATRVADAQWPLVAGVIAGFILSFVWWPLAIAAIVASVVWGQFVQVHGLAQVILPHRRAALTHILTSTVVAILPWLIVSSRLAKFVMYALGAYMDSMMDSMMDSLFGSGW